jgi:ABC-type dipeptide/oligopeptide/nickel transport system permease subunit
MNTQTYDKKKARREQTRKFLKTLFSRKIVLVAAAGVLIFLLLAVFAKVITPYDPNTTSPHDMLQNPSIQHLLGTDQFGRDTLTRLIYGTQVSLVVGVLAVAIACFIGVVLGLFAAYFGGWVDVIIMRCSDALMSIPMIMIALALIAIMGQGIANLAIILGISTIPGYIRLMRGQALSVKESDYVKAGQIQGGKSLYMMMRHILPNAISPIIVMMTQQIGFAILMEAGLSFIGVGVSIPIASWGTMVADGKNYLMANPILAISPGVAIALLVICFNVLGDGIRDALDPRLRGEI